MRRALCVWRSLRTNTSCRAGSSFAELYGREPDDEGMADSADARWRHGGSASTPLSSPSLTSSSALPLTSSPSLKKPITVEGILQQYEDQLYINPSSCDARWARDTLSMVRAALHDRRTDSAETERSRSQVWLKALRILSEASAATASDKRTNLAETLEATNECLAVLRLTNQHSAALSLGEHTLQALAPPQPSASAATSAAKVLEERLDTTQAYCAVVTLLTACVLEHGEEAAAPLTPMVVSFVESVLRVSRARSQSAKKDEKADVAQACAGLIWALDWVWHWCPDVLPKAWTAVTLRAHALPWMTHTFDERVSVDSALAAQSPPSHLVKAALAASSTHHERAAAENGRVAGGEALKRLYLSGVTRTQQTPALRLFQLPIRLGECILTTPQVPATLQTAVLHAHGTALSPAAVEAYASAAQDRTPNGGDGAGSRRPGRATLPLAVTPFDAAVDVLAHMYGPASYHALRRLSKSAKKPHLLATVQHMYGDVLSDEAGVTWQRALAAVEETMQHGDISWQKMVPNTLRLLADAEKSTAFFKLLAEYRPDAASSAVVAASLASVMRQTRRWWHALEVVDLIADAKIPQSESEDLFLQEAGLDTLAALRDAQRWEACLALFATMHNLWQPSSRPALSSIMWSTVVEMPVGAPWEAAAALVSATLPAPKSASALLSLTHAADDDPQALHKLPRHRKARQRLLFLLSTHGRWRTLFGGLALMNKYESDEAAAAEVRAELWRHVLRALEHAPCETRLDAVQTCLAAVPTPVVARDRSMLRHVFRVCERLGLLSTFATVLARIQRENAQTAPVDAPFVQLCEAYDQLLTFLLSDDRGAAAHTRRHLGDGDQNRLPVVRDRFIVQQYLRHVRAAPLRLQYVWPRETGNGRYLHHLSKSDAIRQLARDLHCGADQVQLKGNTKECAWLYSPRSDPLPADHLLLSTALAVIAFKPPGVVLAKVAVATVVAAKRSDVFVPLYEMPPGWSGLFVLRPTTLRKTGLEVQLSVTVCVLPLTTNAVPLMATSWWKAYKCRIRSEGRFSLASRSVTIDCILHTDGHETVDELIRRWRTTVNADGWGLVEGEGGVSGESAHVSAVTVVESDAAATTTKASTALLPHWLQPISATGDEDAFDEIAFLGGTHGS